MCKKLLFNLMLIAIFFVAMFMPCVSNNCFAQQEFIASGKKLGLADFLELAAQKEAAGDNREASRYLNQAATIHWEKKEYDKAITYFEKSLKLNEAIGNEQGMSGINSNLGMIYADQQQYAKAVDCFDKVLEHKQKGNDKESLIYTYINASVVLNNIKEYAKSAMYLEAALDIAQELSNTEQMKSCYGMLSETYTKAGESEKAKKYFDMYRTFHEMLQRDKELVYKQSAEESRLRMQLAEFEKQNKELALAAAKKEIKEQAKTLDQYDSTNQALLVNMSKQELLAKWKEAELTNTTQRHEAKLNEEKQIRYAVLAIMAIMLIAGAFLYRSYREKRKINHQLAEQNAEILAQQDIIVAQKDELEKHFDLIAEKNQNITASITYAQRIQAAMLTDTQNLQKLISQSFIFFKPRDIVSGDFYWFKEWTGNHGEKKVLVAAVDCTGHGVPGAFMSMIGSNLLHQIVANDIVSPELVLQELHKGITTALHQENGENKDGMDMVLCTFDKKHKKVEFAGAKNKLLYIQNNEIHEIKGDKHPIGGKDKTESSRTFTKHTIDTKQPTTFYLFTDGYQDQFGGIDNRKFMISQLKQLLLSIHSKEMAEQKTIVKDTIEKWRGKEHQIDDILVMGVKV
jgi:serine phosphatase RsbU (regulator of sigma subunit)